MKIVIVEDDLSVAANLVDCIHEIDEAIEIIAVLQTVKEAILFFNISTAYDLVFMDIELSDGFATGIFKQVEINSPIIFSTAFTEYALEAFKLNGIDYMVKPISTDDVAYALKKFYNLKKITSDSIINVINSVQNRKTNKKLLVAKKGTEFYLLNNETVACLFSENFIVFAIDAQEKKYLLQENNLSLIYDQLDQETFFKASRKFLINVNYIKSYRVVDRVRLHIELTVNFKDPIIISQEKAKEFKQWIRVK